MGSLSVTPSRARTFMISPCRVEAETRSKSSRAAYGANSFTGMRPNWTRFACVCQTPTAKVPRSLNASARYASHAAQVSFSSDLVGMSRGPSEQALILRCGNEALLIHEDPSQCTFGHANAVFNITAFRD